MDTATKTEIDAVITCLKGQFKKPQKLQDKITSVDKPKEKEKGQTKEIEQIYILPEKRQQIIDYLRLF